MTETVKVITAPNMAQGASLKTVIHVGVTERERLKKKMPSGAATLLGIE